MNVGRLHGEHYYGSLYADVTYALFDRNHDFSWNQFPYQILEEIYQILTEPYSILKEIYQILKETYQILKEAYPILKETYHVLNGAANMA